MFGTKTPAAGTPILPLNDLWQKVWALNRPTAPYQIREGQAEGVHLVAEWKIVDAQWYQIFAKAGLKKTFKVLLWFDEIKHEVRAVDQEFSVAWEAGVPRIGAAVSAFRGQKFESSFGQAYAFTEDLGYGQVYKYRFNTQELKEPLQQVITGGGWTYRPVAFGSLK